MANSSLVAHVSFDPDGNRIPLPKHLSDRLSWLVGSESVSGWLWMISPGRYRLLSDGEVEADPYLAPLRDLILEQQHLVPSAVASAGLGLKEASTAARLHPVQLKVNKSYWRLSFPSVLEEFIPLGCDAKRISTLLGLDGYLELWYTEVLRSALFNV